MGAARAIRGVRREIALIALVAKPPELAGRIPMIDEELGDVVNLAERVAGGGERRVVVAVQEDDRRAPDAAGGPESDDRHAQRGVEDHRKVGGERGPDLPGAAGPRPWQQDPPDQ